MNKQELKAQLAEKFYKVGETIQNGNEADRAIRKKEGIGWYSIGVYEQSPDDPDVLIRKQVQVYVADEGLPTEKAFYMEKKPWAEKKVEPVVVEPAPAMEQVVMSAPEPKIEPAPIEEEPVAEVKLNVFQRIGKVFRG